MENDFSVLIPHYEQQTALHFVMQAYSRQKRPLISFWKDVRNAKREARDIVSAMYWEAYNCENTERQEYWRVVLNCIDLIDKI